MPWHVTEDDRCPTSRPWGVVKDDDGELEGCHATQDDAKDQLAALYANEDDRAGGVMTAPTRADLRRSVPFEVVRADEGSDGLTLEGYAAVFDSPTVIDSWEGRFEESLRRGAFSKTIRQNTPVLQFDHGMHPLIGSIPIGKIRSLREDERGLFVSARLTDNWLIQPVRDTIADEAVSGMSFRFSVVREEWRDAGGKLLGPDEVMRLLFDAGERGPLKRLIKEAKVAELGPVVWPAYAGTAVGVRSRMAVVAMEDPQVRAEVAALLDRAAPRHDPAAPPDEGHPAQHDDEESSTDAPPDEGHPPVTDAPLRDEHPSPRPATSLDPGYLRRYAQLNAGRLALITQGAARYER